MLLDLKLKVALFVFQFNKLSLCDEYTPNFLQPYFFFRWLLYFYYIHLCLDLFFIALFYNYIDKLFYISGVYKTIFMNYISQKSKLSYVWFCTMNLNLLVLIGSILISVIIRMKLKWNINKQILLLLVIFFFNRIFGHVFSYNIENIYSTKWVYWSHYI